MKAANSTDRPKEVVSGSTEFDVVTGNRDSVANHNTLDLWSIGERVLPLNSECAISY